MTPANTAILLPVLGMLVLTFFVWTHMYVRRIGYMRRARIRPERLRSPAGKARALPDEVSFPAHNLSNLFELPVVFYVVCIVLYVTGTANSIDVFGAWIFFFLRCLHSIVQCTVNHVMLRFSLYLLSSLVLWWLVLSTLIRLLQGT